MRDSYQLSDAGNIPPISMEVKSQSVAPENRYNLGTPKSLMAWDGSRIVALRGKLGSLTRPLSRADLVRVVNAQLPREEWISESGIQRYEAKTPPPYAAARVMAALAGLSMDEFMLGGPLSIEGERSLESRGDAQTPGLPQQPGASKKRGA